MNATAAGRRRRRLRVHRFKGSQPRPVHRCTDGNLSGRGRFVKSSAVVIESRPRGAAGRAEGCFPFFVACAGLIGALPGVDGGYHRGFPLRHELAQAHSAPLGDLFADASPQLCDSI